MNDLDLENVEIEAKMGGVGLRIPTKRGVLSVQMTPLHYCKMGESFEIMMFGNSEAQKICGIEVEQDQVRGWITEKELNKIIKNLNK